METEHRVTFFFFSHGEIFRGLFRGFPKNVSETLFSASYKALEFLLPPPPLSPFFPSR